MSLHIHTRLVHPDGPAAQHRPTVAPVYLSSTFDQESATAFGEYDYSRSGNPTRSVLESQIAALEGGGRSFAFASGVAAIAAVTRLLKPGEEILAANDLYGGTQRIFSTILPDRGVDVRYCAASNADRFLGQASFQTRLVYLEPVGNPMLTVYDVRAIVEAARRREILVAVDNTLLSPLNLRPLDLGADIVIHSATKYLGGHSDVTAGVVTVRKESLAEHLYRTQNGEGSALPPFDCYQLERGLRTLALRLERQQENATKIAQFIQAHGGLRQVRYPTLTGHPGREILAREGCTGGGAVVCFETGCVETSKRLIEALRLFSIRVSFGTVSSSASLPFYMSHASVPQQERDRHGLPQDLVRLSVGIEHIDDLIADLSRALDIAGVPGRTPATLIEPKDHPLSIEASSKGEEAAA
ncbi:MAG: PLP-dependent transferase [Phycisphaerales bacterium]|nr:PLP-dependent transferase [Planctomycetota bacterium]